MRRSVKRALAAGAVGLFATTAWAFPWDIDMVDAVFLRAYKWQMAPLPEGTVSRNQYIAPLDRMTEADGLANPKTASGSADAATLATGQRMFDVYCAACHGPQGLGGAPVVDNNPEAGKRRYQIPPAKLSGPGAITPVRSDGWIYLTIRNGGNIMPSYHSQLTDDEMWSVVAYIRTLDGAARFNVPAAPAQ